MERILGERSNGDKVEVRVRWVEGGEETWEPVEGVSECEAYGKYLRERDRDKRWNRKDGMLSFEDLRSRKKEKPGVKSRSRLGGPPFPSSSSTAISNAALRRFRLQEGAPRPQRPQPIPAARPACPARKPPPARPGFARRFGGS